MARLRTKLTFLLSEDANEVSQVYERLQLNDELTDAYVNGSSRKVALLPTASLAVSLDGLTNVQFVYVEASSEVTVALNGGTPAVKVTPRNNTSTVPSALPGKFLVWTEGVTSVTITNPSATVTASVKVVLAGW